MKYGRIDIHSHLLPGIDDGCQTTEESIRCARAMVGAGYTHSFVTPHIWPQHEHIHVDSISGFTRSLQAALDEAGVDLHLIPGGENNLGPKFHGTPPDRVVTCGLARRHVLIDFWCDVLPDFFEATIEWLHALGLTVIIAHPERVRAIQCEPELADYFRGLGVLLQGNLQCLSDPPEAPTRRVIEQYLLSDRYTFLASDLHRWDTLGIRLDGLRRAIELVGEAKVDQLTRVNPLMLLPEGANE